MNNCQINSVVRFFTFFFVDLLLALFGALYYGEFNLLTAICVVLIMGTQLVVFKLNRSVSIYDVIGNAFAIFLGAIAAWIIYDILDYSYATPICWIKWVVGLILGMEIIKILIIEFNYKNAGRGK